MIGKEITRRQFFAGSAALCGTAMLSTCTTPPVSPPTVVDQVTLGRTGLKMSRLGIGTGTLHSGDVQMALGKDGFIRLVRYAYDQGVTYIDTSVGYQTMPWMSDALKGLPREDLFILSKLETRTENPRQAIDDLRRTLGTEYIDCLLVHGVRTADWDSQCPELMDALSEAKQNKIILSHGCSYHGMPAIERSSGMDWVEANLIRYNPQGVYMDPVSTEQGAQSDESCVPVVEGHMGVMRERGQGLIAMKVFAEGRLVEAEERAASIRHAMQAGYVDAIVIGFKSPAEIDEAIFHMNRSLAEMHANAPQCQVAV